MLAIGQPPALVGSSETDLTVRIHRPIEPAVSLLDNSSLRTRIESPEAKPT